MRKLNKAFVGYVLGLLAAYATFMIDAQLGVWEFVGWKDAAISRTSNLSFCLATAFTAIGVWIISRFTKDSCDSEREQGKV